MSRDPRDGRRGLDPDDAEAVRRRLQALVTLSRNDEACRLLGVEGVLEGQLELEFLDDPLDWIAYDIASAFTAGESDEEIEEVPHLTTLVAELRLYRALHGEVDEAALQRSVMTHIAES